MNKLLIFLGQAIPSFLGMLGFYIVLLFLDNADNIAINTSDIIKICVFGSIIWITSGVKMITLIDHIKPFNTTSRIRFLLIYLLAGVGIYSGIEYLLNGEFIIVTLNILLGLIIGISLFIIDFKYIYKVL